MKQRFSALDVRATVADLKHRLLGLRLQNIYDVNAKTFLLKFSKPDRKELILVESGIRFHSTKFAREKNAIPTPFCAKIRKCCRTRRLTNVTQLGTDRIVDFEFAGGGEESLGFHIICEFYASGNVILTDQNYNILTLLRVVKQTEELHMAVGEVYNLQQITREFERVTRDRILEILKAAGPKDTLKKLLNAKLDYGPSLTEHAVLSAGLTPSMKISTELDLNEDSKQLNDLMTALQQADDIVETFGRERQKGYISSVERGASKSKADEKDEDRPALSTYDEFQPFLFEQMKDKSFQEYESFDLAVDEFFSKLESQKLELKSQAQEEAAMKKLDAVRVENSSRVEELQEAQLRNMKKAELIEINLELVDQALLVVQNAIASSMDWKDLADLVVEERARGNPVAAIIHGLKLETGQITLKLRNPYDDDEEALDSDEEDASVPDSNDTEMKIDVELDLSAYANARRYYNVKKQSATKQDKTIAAATKAMKNAERKILKDLKDIKVTATINQIRKPLWFEKFQWFISQDRYLVIAGRDAQQNELIVKRYLTKGDVYVHADLSGAASVVVKNIADGGDLPPGVLAHAGIMSVCQSRAWDAKIVTSAWWVYADQVSKTAPTGEYLTTGSFMIRGKKNFLPPTQLVYGFGILFKLDESSTARLVNSRKDDQAMTEQEELGEEEGDDVANDELTISSDSLQARESLEQLEEDGPANEEQVSDSRPGDVSGADRNSPDDEEKVYDKYELDDYGNVTDEDLNDVADQQNVPNNKSEGSKTKLSAKERKDIKKQRTRGTEDIKSDEKQSTGNVKGSIEGADTEKATGPSVPPPVRGKKLKMKKLKEKYGEQDEEERELRMGLLGSAKGPQPKGKKAKREAEKAVELAARRERREASAVAQNSEQNAPVSEASSQRETVTVDSKLEDAPAEHAKDAQEAAEIRRMLLEENVTVLDSEEAEGLSLLDALTGVPLQDDVLLHAIPVCAPYAALQRFKYKVKLTPGTMKKGKAVKASVNFFLAALDAGNREKELIKSIPDPEMITAMMGKVKVSAPNMEAVKKKSKQKGGRK